MSLYFVSEGSRTMIGSGNGWGTGDITWDNED